MSDEKQTDNTNNANEAQPTNSMFGVTNETKSTNIVQFDKGGFQKLLLKDVVSEEIGKNEKYNTLSFKFTSLDGIKTFKHTEFELGANTEDMAKSMQALNSRIKHLFETYHTFPTEGVGIGASSFKDFFDKVALAFNTHGTGKPIYKNETGNSIPIWGKLVYSKKGELRFPVYPNFVERITNKEHPLTLTIDNRYDTVVQPQKQSVNPLDGNGVFGGPNKNDDNNGF